MLHINDVGTLLYDVDLRWSMVKICFKLLCLSQMKLSSAGGRVYPMYKSIEERKSYRQLVCLCIGDSSSIPWKVANRRRRLTLWLYHKLVKS